MLSHSWVAFLLDRWSSGRGGPGEADTAGRRHRHETQGAVCEERNIW